MIEERRDNNIFVLGLLFAAALAFYGLWTEEVPIVVELVELVKNQVVKYLEPQTITRVDQQIIYLTATPGPSVNELIYSSPVAVADQQQEQAITEAEKEAILRALTAAQRSWIGIPLTPVPSPTWTLIPPPPPSTMPPMPATEVPAPTQAPAPTYAPAPTQAPAPTYALAPTQAAPPTWTSVPPTWTPAPPTWTPAPPTWTPAPPTWTPAPPTWTPPPPTLMPTASVQLVAPDLLNSQEDNPELAPTSGIATINGKISSEEKLTMILTNGDYYAAIEATGGQFSFENVPNGTYNLSANPSGPGAGCGQITVSVPEGHRVFTHHYRYYKHQCVLQQ